MFIDSAIDDIEVLIESFDDNTEVYIIQSDVDGFKEMQNILADEKTLMAFTLSVTVALQIVLVMNLNNETLNE